jgi:rod shape-determining protein MreD
MSPSARRGIGLGAAIFLAALAQIVYADSLRIHGARPDFLIVVTVLGAMFCDANGGAALGFFAGLLHASFAAPPLAGFGSLIVSRVLVGFGVGWLEERIFRDNVLIAVALVALGTLLVEGLFFLFAPQQHILHWARSVGFTTLYNAVLAVPLYLLVRRMAGMHRPHHEI